MNPMRREWDERARVNPWLYTNGSSSEEGYVESGERDYRALLEPLLAQMDFSPNGKEVLDIGAGIGRMIPSFAKRFASVCALDVSPEMVRKGRALTRELDNVEWVLGNGVDLSPLRDESFDLVFSYSVFHCIPLRETVLGMARETMRVLRRGGAFVFSFGSGRIPQMNLRGRSLWWTLDRLHTPALSMKLERAGRALAARAGVDFLKAGPTFHGALVEPEVVVEAVEERDGVIHGLSGVGTIFTWCYGRKAVHDGVTG